MLPFALLMSAMLIGIPGLFFCFYGIYLALKMMSGKKVVFLYEQGLIDARKKQINMITYHQIREFTLHKQKQYLMNFLGIPCFYICTNHRYILKLEDGKKIQFFSELQNRDRFGELLGQQMSIYHISHAMQAYQAGQILEFGRLKLTKSGLSTSRKVLPWSEIGSIEITDSTYGSGLAITTNQINAKGQYTLWLGFSLKDIPNPHLLQSLVRAILSNPSLLKS
jgi:hypothetical protein